MPSGTTNITFQQPSYITHLFSKTNKPKLQYCLKNNSESKTPHNSLQNLCATIILPHRFCFSLPCHIVIYQRLQNCSQLLAFRYIFLLFRILFFLRISWISIELVTINSIINNPINSLINMVI